jgi:hypothetical protein
VVEAEPCFSVGVHGLKILAGGFQQGISANDVDFNKACRAVYGSIYVAFGGQVQMASGWCWANTSSTSLPLQMSTYSKA